MAYFRRGLFACGLALLASLILSTFNLLATPGDIVLFCLLAFGLLTARAHQSHRKPRSLNWDPPAGES